MPSSSSRLYRRIADDLVQAIQRHEYAVGEKLPGERELAERFSVSRPTIREAMIALEIYGVIEIRHGVGNIVVANAVESSAKADLPPDDLDVGAFELVEARMVIEGGVAALAAISATESDFAVLQGFIDGMQTEDIHAAEAADREFHQYLARITKNGPLIDAVELLWDLRNRSMLAQAIDMRARGSGMPDRQDEHSVILDGLRRHDAVSARQAMTFHLERVRDYLLDSTEAEELEILKKKQRDTREAVTKRGVF